MPEQTVRFRFTGDARDLKAAANQVKGAMNEMRGATEAQRREQASLASSAGRSARSQRELARETSAAERSMARATRGAIAGSGAFSHLGRSVAFASASFLGAAGLIHVIGHSISLASDLERQVNRTNKLFEGSAPAIQRWSKDAASSIGLARGEALKFANDLGQMLVPLGIAPGRAAEMSKQMSILVGNLAAFRDEDPELVLHKLEAGLRGRGMGLKAYGIIIDQTAVKQEAIRLGLVKEGQAIDAQTKALAAYSIIQQQAGRYQDEFSKSSDSLAVQQRKLHAQLQNVQEELGQELVPIMLNVVKGIGDWLSVAKNQERVHRDLTQAVHLAKDAFAVFWEVLKVGKGLFDSLAKAVGGTERAIKLLLGVMVISKVAKFAAAIAGVEATSLAGSMGTATAASGLFRKALLAMGDRAVLFALSGVGLAIAGLAAGMGDLFSHMPGHGTTVIPGRGAATSLGAPTNTTPIASAIGFGGKHGLPVGTDIGSAADWEVAVRNGKYFVKIQNQWYPISAVVAAKGMGLTLPQLAQAVKNATGGAAGQGAQPAAGALSVPSSLGSALTRPSGSTPGSLLQREHDTSGLSGFPAVDISAIPGQAVPAPENGTLSRITGHPPSEGSHGAAGVLGYSLYFIGDGGTTYYMTHLMAVAPQGRYRKGQTLATVAYHPRGTHLHIGYHKGFTSIATAPSTQPPTLARQGGGGAAPPPSTSSPANPAIPPAISTQVVGRISAPIKPARGSGGAALPAGWAEQILDGIPPDGAPHTPGNIAFLQAWQRHEGGSNKNNATYNPLCTTIKGYGGVSINSDGVKAFPSWEQGLAATIATLSLPRYAAIRTALRSGALGEKFKPTEEFAKELSKWSKGGYSSLGVGAPDLVAGTVSGGATTPAAARKTTPPLFKGHAVLQDAVTQAQTAVAQARSTVAKDAALQREMTALLSLQDAIDKAAGKAKGVRLQKLHTAAKGVAEDIKRVQGELDRDLETLVAPGRQHDALAHAVAVMLGASGGATGPRGEGGVEGILRRRTDEQLAAMKRAIPEAKARIVAAAKQAQKDVATALATEAPLETLPAGLTLQTFDPFGRLTSTTTLGAVRQKIHDLFNQFTAAAAKDKPRLAAQLAEIISGAMSQAVDAASAARSTFSEAFSRVSATIMEAFDRETQSHISAMQAANQAAINAVQQSAQAQITRLQEQANARIQSLQEALQKRIKRMQDTLQKEIAKLEEKRAQPTPSEGALTALQQQHDAAAAAQALADARQALSDAQNAADASTPEGQKAIADAQASLNDVLYQQQVAALEKSAQAEREALDKSTQAKEDALTKQEQAQEASLTKQEQDEEAQIQKSLQARIDAINAATEAQVEALNAQEAAAETEYQDERAIQRQALEDELAAHLAHLLDQTESIDQFLAWLQGKNASGVFGKFLSPVVGMALAGDSQGKAFYNGFMTYLRAAADAWNTFVTAVANGQAATIPTGTPNPQLSNAVGQASGKGACFVAGTLIRTPDAQVPIESMRIGDTALVWDITEGEIVESVVTDTFVHQGRSTLVAHFEDGTVVEATPEHPFYADGDWIELRSLAPGAQVLTVNGRTAFTGFSAAHAGREVFNLHMEHPDHNYFAAGLLVHNKLAMQGGGKLPAPLGGGRTVGMNDMVVYRGTPGETVVDQRLTRALEDVFVRGRGGAGGVVITGNRFYGGTERQVHEALARATRPYVGRVASYRSPQ